MKCVHPWKNVEQVMANPKLSTGRCTGVCIFIWCTNCREVLEIPEEGECVPGWWRKEARNLLRELRPDFEVHARTVGSSVRLIEPTDEIHEKVFILRPDLFTAASAGLDELRNLEDPFAEEKK